MTLPHYPSTPRLIEYINANHFDIETEWPIRNLSEQISAYSVNHQYKTLTLSMFLNIEQLQILKCDFLMDSINVCHFDKSGKVLFRMFFSDLSYPSGFNITGKYDSTTSLEGELVFKFGKFEIKTIDDVE